MMRFENRGSWLIPAAAFLLSWLSIPDAGEGGCRQGSAICSLDPNCIRIPTSLPPCGGLTDIGFTVEPAAFCGVKTCPGPPPYACGCGKLWCPHDCGWDGGDS